MSSLPCLLFFGHSRWCQSLIKRLDVVSDADFADWGNISSLVSRPWQGLWSSDDDDNDDARQHESTTFACILCIVIASIDNLVVWAHALSQSPTSVYKRLRCQQNDSFLHRIQWDINLPTLAETQNHTTRKPAELMHIKPQTRVPGLANCGSRDQGL